MVRRKRICDDDNDDGDVDIDKPVELWFGETLGGTRVRAVLTACVFRMLCEKFPILSYLASGRPETRRGAQDLSGDRSVIDITGVGIQCVAFVAFVRHSRTGNWDMSDHSAEERRAILHVADVLNGGAAHEYDFSDDPSTIDYALGATVVIEGESGRRAVDLLKNAGLSFVACVGVMDPKKIHIDRPSRSSASGSARE
jgi:hypothetical protein